VQSLLADYNLTTTKPMFLAVSLFAVDHLVRVLRVLQMPNGHALLVGVGGSGRKVCVVCTGDLCVFVLARHCVFSSLKLPEHWPNSALALFLPAYLSCPLCTLLPARWSVLARFPVPYPTFLQSLTRLAAYIGGLQLAELDITLSYSLADWRADLKRVCWKAGVDGVPTVLVFSETQAKQPQFLEDLNNLLNSGEVPTLLSRQEKAEAAEKMRDASPALAAVAHEDAGACAGSMLTRCA
jgi:hypothetical protein